MTEQGESPPKNIQTYFVEGGMPVYYYPAKRNLELPSNLLPETLIDIAWPDRKGGIAYYRVEKPPEKGREGIYVHALTPDELKEFKKNHPNPQTHHVGLKEF